MPTEKVTEFKGGKKKIVERKFWPGYIAVEMHVNDDTWFAIRETSGIGDFTGSAGKPTPMQPHEIAMILHTEEEETEEAPKLDIKFTPGDKVKVMEGNFENFEGEVSSIDETHGRVTVMLSIFGRPTPVELEYWQVEVFIGPLRYRALHGVPSAQLCGTILEKIPAPSLPIPGVCG